MDKIKKIPDFGDYVCIEMYRHYGDNEFLLAKVINNMKSNTYVTVPIAHGIGKTGYNEIIHEETVDAISCIICGIDETEVRRYALKDVKITRDYISLNKKLNP